MLIGIADKELEAIAKKIGPQAMEIFARGYLGVDGDEIEDMKFRRRGDTAGFKFDILKHWKNQNQRPNAREVGVIAPQSVTKRFPSDSKISGSHSHKCSV